MILPQSFLRVRQFTRALRAASLTAPELLYISNVLNTEQHTLFLNLPVYEQHHALNVCRSLVSGGFGDDRELLQAALLHDLGKFDPASGLTIPIWIKVANVALGKLAGEKLTRRLSNGHNPRSWRYLFWLQLTHEQRGVSLAEGAGSSRRVLALLDKGRAAPPAKDRAAAALEWADNLN